MAVTVEVNLARIRANAIAVADRAGVPLLAVVKADAYGLGTAAVADALADLGDRLAGFYVFDAAEADGLFRRTGKRSVALHGTFADPDDYRRAGIHPVVWSVDRAAALRRARPVLSLDTGQQRFAVAVDHADAVRMAGDCHEAMTHATRPDQVEQLRQFAADWHPRPVLHAAGTALLDDATTAVQCRLDAVRPGLALYRGAVRVSAPLVEVRDSTGPAGYTGFCVPRFGVVIVGYRDGLKPGPCRVGGRPVTVLEVGMQSAFVEVGPDARVGDSVVLLGPDETTGPSDGLSEAAVAAAWRVSPQEVLVRLSAAGVRQYHAR